ncbi:unnamed protein product [Rhizopus stolonifer]
MEGLLKSMVDSRSDQTESLKEIESPKRTRDDSNMSIERMGKIIRYHGSSSGYHLVENIFSSAESQKPESTSVDHTNFSAKEQNEQSNELCLPSVNGQGTYRIRKLDMNDDDLMVVRDTTADEEALRTATDNQESMDDVIPRSVVLELAKVYFSSNPLLPILDRDEYMDALEGKISTPPAPLLTYAICSSACFLVNPDDPIFKDASVERNEIYHLLIDRASALFRIEYLVPRISTIQAFVLFAGHPALSNTAHKNWILAGMAVRMAQDLGLHRMMKSVESLAFNTKRKRLWYSVYVTDRWCCAILGRPLAIADSDCDVDLSSADKLSPTEDLTIFLSFVKLSGILGEVLRRLYSPRARANGYKTSAVEQTVGSLQKMLEDWYVNVPDDYKISESDLHNILENPSSYQDTIKITQGGPLTICYYAVVILLHRPFVAMEKDAADMPFLAKNADICISAAKLSIRIAQVVPSKSLIMFGWNSAGCAVFSAALIHAFNTKNSDPKIANDAREFLRISIDEVLDPMSKGTPVDNHMVTFLRAIPGILDRPSFTKESRQHKQNIQIPPPMSVQHILSEYQEPEKDIDSSEKLTSWLFSVPETSFWQSLFSNSGTLLQEETIGGGFESEGWNSFFMES